MGSRPLREEDAHSKKPDPFLGPANLPVTPGHHLVRTVVAVAHMPEAVHVLVLAKNGLTRYDDRRVGVVSD
jgi:hypothetical protein